MTALKNCYLKQAECPLDLNHAIKAINFLKLWCVQIGILKRALIVFLFLELAIQTLLLGLLRKLMDQSIFWRIRAFQQRTNYKNWVLRGLVPVQDQCDQR